MKAISLFVCGFMLASASAYAADKKPANTRLPIAQQKQQQSQTEQQKNSKATWQDCVQNYTKESGYSQEEAYKQCDGLQ